MSEFEAKAEVFVSVFKSLSKAERDAVVERLTEDRVAARDMLDWATAFRRRNEPTYDFETYVASRRKRSKRL